MNTADKWKEARRRGWKARLVLALHVWFPRGRWQLTAFLVATLLILLSAIIADLLA